MAVLDFPSADTVRYEPYLTLAEGGASMHPGVHPVYSGAGVWAYAQAGVSAVPRQFVWFDPLTCSFLQPGGHELPNSGFVALNKSQVGTVAVPKQARFSEADHLQASH